MAKRSIKTELPQAQGIQAVTTVSQEAIKPSLEPVDLDPAIAQAKVEIAESAGTRRGRKPGSKVRPDGSVAQPGAPAAPAAAPLQSAAVPLKLAFMALSNLPATSYKMPELALTEEEAEPLAQAADQVLVAFTPQLSMMSPKTAALLSLGMVAGTIFISKAQVYYAIKAEREKEAPRDNPADKGGAKPDPAAGVGGAGDSIVNEKGFSVPPGGGIQVAASDVFRKRS